MRASGALWLVGILLAAGCGRTDREVLEQPPPARLSIQTADLAAARVGAPYDVTLELAFQTPARPFTFRRVAGALPPGLQLTSTGSPRARIAGTPTAPGRYDFEVEVRDTAGVTDRAAFAIFVEDTEPLSIFGRAFPLAVRGALYETRIQATGGAGGYRWRVVQGRLPDGLSLDAEGTPSTVLGGTPREVGRFDVRVQVRDGLGEEAARSFLLEVAETSEALRVVTDSLPSGRRDAPYEATIRARGGAGPAAGYDWALVRGGLPPSLTLEAGPEGTALIRGVPATEGTFDLRVRVRDALGNEAFRDLTLRIATPIAPLRISTRQLPVGEEGAPYEAVLEATGGQPPYAWSQAGPGLPPA